MAKVRLDPMFAGISGTIGDFVFKRTKNGETIITKRPEPSRAEPSPAQKAQRERFKQASQYARAALADPNMRALYEEMAAKQGKSVFAAARADYFIKKDLLSEK